MTEKQDTFGEIAQVTPLKAAETLSDSRLFMDETDPVAGQFSESMKKLDEALLEGTQELQEKVALIFKEMEMKVFKLHPAIMKRLIEDLNTLAKSIRTDVNKSLKHQHENGYERKTPGICCVLDVNEEPVTEAGALDKLPKGSYTINARVNFKADAMNNVKKCFAKSSYLKNKVVEELSNLFGSCEVTNLRTDQGDRVDAVIFTFDLKI